MINKLINWLARKQLHELGLAILRLEEDKYRLMLKVGKLQAEVKRLKKPKAPKKQS